MFSVHQQLATLAAIASVMSAYDVLKVVCELRIDLRRCVSVCACGIYMRMHTHMPMYNE